MGRRSIWLIALALAGCKARQRDFEYEQPVTVIDGAVVDQSVIDMLTARHDISEQEAREMAVFRLRLARAAEKRTAEANASTDEDVASIDPERAELLRKTALARLTLEQDFEAKHGPEAIPENLVEANMERSIDFHPKVHFVCQVLVVPNEEPPEGQALVFAPEDEAWWEGAQGFLGPLYERMERYVPDPGAEPDCKRFLSITRALPKLSPDEAYSFRGEGAVFETCARDRLDPGFVDALCEVDDPGWYGPFRTAYGLHYAAVLRVEDEFLPEPAARRSYLRDSMLDAWRAQKYPEYIEVLRNERTVRIAGPGEAP